jgi:hypothetical protein
LSQRKGWLRLYPQFAAREKVARMPSVLLQKFPAQKFAVETSLELMAQPGEEAGLIVAGESSATLGVERTSNGNRLVLRFDGVETFSRANVPNAIRLGVAVEPGGVCRFSFTTVDGLVSLEPTFQARKGVWIGAKVGLYSMNTIETENCGYADFDYFRFS